MGGWLSSAIALYIGGEWNLYHCREPNPGRPARSQSVVLKAGDNVYFTFILKPFARTHLLSFSKILIKSFFSENHLLSLPLVPYQQLFQNPAFVSWKRNIGTNNGPLIDDYSVI
jgi:hypothetical protein